MKDFFRKNGLMVVIAALLLTAAVSIASALMPVNPVTNLLGVLATPFRAASTAVTSWVQGVWRYATEYDDLQNRVQELELQVAQMEEENREAVKAMEENERLRALLELREKRRDFVFESARVTARSTSNWASTLTLSKGTSAGVEVGNCVITETGELVGVVSEAGLNWSTVSTVINTDIEMGGIVTRTHSAGILEGDFALMGEGRLKLSYLPDGAQLVSGDEVLTSGKGDVYPSGLVVGQVEGVFTDPSGMTRYAVVVPAVQFDSLIEVFVIKDFDIVE